MKFGVNTELVEEVIALFRNLDFTDGPSIDDGLFEVINDFEEAKTLAWTKTYGTDEFTWPDLKAEQMSRVWDSAYRIEKFNEADSLLSKTFDEISGIITRKLTGNILEVLDEIVSDFHGCLYSRYVFGNTNYFYETLFIAYKSKAWPCGYRNRFASNRMVIYIPGNTKDNPPPQGKPTIEPNTPTS